MRAKFVITVDLGGTKILSALISDKNEIVDRVKEPTDASKGPEFLVSCISEAVKKLIAQNDLKNENIRALSLGVPGTVNPGSGIISVAPNLFIEDFNIKKALQKYFDIPVLLENDVNMAALGIKYFEYKNKVNNMLVVFVGTGIGGALIFDGKMYRGSSFYAGEIGHMKVESNGKFDSNNNSSTFELLASRTAIVEFIKKRSKKEKTILKKYFEKNEKIKSKHLSKALKKKDRVTVEEVEKACKIIGSVLGSLTTLLNVDTIVLGGGVIEANEDYMLSIIKKSFNKSVFEPCKKIVKLTATNLGDDAPLYGGVALANEFLGEDK